MAGTPMTTGDYQQGFYNGVSKCRAIAQQMLDADPDEEAYVALRYLLTDIDALLHEPPEI